MSYPISPFPSNFNTKIIRKSQTDNTDEQRNDSKLKELLQWLCSSPKLSSYRVNLLKFSTEEILLKIKRKLLSFTSDSVNVELCTHLPDVILIHSFDTKHWDLCTKSLEVIVDVHCAAAVLRGANIFAPGVLGMQQGVKIGDEVSIYADLDNKCKKGFRKVLDAPNKFFVGNGIARQTRSQLFGENLNPSGIAVELYSNISGCLVPALDFLPEGSYLLQNLPSIICTYILNPQSGECVLDMCAAPGNKTTHIAALMANKGTIIAIDKTPRKIQQLKENCKIFGANVAIYQADSTKIFDNSLEDFSSVASGPPFGRKCFDRILLDAPCSALGKRPQLRNNTSEKVIKSYVPLQRKLFENAVNLLKENGCLVYSTCTITQAENEGLVAWALSKFKCLTLQRGTPHLGEPGWPTDGLSQTDLQNVQRFGPESNVDSVGFFVALFIKHSFENVQSCNV